MHRSKAGRTWLGRATFDRENADKRYDRGALDLRRGHQVVYLREEGDHAVWDNNVRKEGSPDTRRVA